MVSIEYSDNQDIQASDYNKKTIKSYEVKTKLTLSIPKAIAKGLKSWCVQNDTTVSAFLVAAFKEKREKN